MPKNIKLYHITHIRNLTGIVESGLLLSQSQVHAERVPFINIAHNTLQDRRASTRVPCGPDGTLHDYVPFYFASRSPMLYSINQGNVEGYDEGQGPVLHLVTSIKNVLDAGLGFVFTDGHGIMDFTDFYDDLKDLDHVDWDVMKATYWADTEDDTDRRRRRQAEFLIHEKLPFQYIEEIGVIDRTVQEEVESLMRASVFRPGVAVRRGWYY
ncbi:MAG: DUF4433 domain-containing protein [Thermodesulfobacteriota bacterium]|nr:DUF4433 domain-containing protein [Thermodesulfobacteriota bacterium]